MTKINSKSIYLNGFILEGYEPHGVVGSINIVNAGHQYTHKYHCHAPHPFINYQEVVEGKDYVKQYEIQPTAQTRWVQVDKNVYDIHHLRDRCRIIAVPIPNDIQEGEKESEVEIELRREIRCLKERIDSIEMTLAILQDA